MANRMKWAIPIFFCVLAYATSAQQGKSLEEQLIKSASDSRDAVLSMMFWGPNGQIDPNHVGVVGSAFLINTDGYFVTAAHMLELYSPNTSQLTVIVKQRDENGAGVWFDVVEKDEKHDLALCKIKSPTIKKLDGKNPKASDHPISTLQVSSEIIQQGQLVAVIGFSRGCRGSRVGQFKYDSMSALR